MNVLDLFSGIGGFSLGLERAGMRTVAFCEIEPHARAVLKKNWPHVPCYDDVRSLTADRLRADGIAADVICGGFPCQDISSAGRQTGIRGERSGLWSEYARIIGEVRPQYVVVENVAALLSGPSERPGEWFGVVLGDLAALGYDAEWHCIPASAIGARHRRDRVWIIAYPVCIDGGSRRPQRPNPSSSWQRESERSLQDVAYADDRLHARGLAGGKAEGEASRSEGIHQGEGRPPYGQRLRSELGAGGPLLADAKRGRLQSRNVERAGSTAIIAAAIGRDCRGRELGKTWRIEPDVGRVAYGVPFAVDRIGELGNAVVPQLPEIIVRAIIEAEKSYR